MADAIIAFEIYRITHRESGKSYIGCTTRGVAFRWRSHIYAANDTKKSFIFQRAIAKYGADAFDVSTVAHANSLKEMFELERKWITECNTVSPNGYNLTGGGDGAHDPSPETRQKLRQNALGNKYFLGRKHSEETKARMSESAIRSTEHRASISRAQKGKALSAETIAKISATKTGVKLGPHSAETKAKISAAHEGMRHSAESIAKMSAARKAWHARRHSVTT